MSTDTRTVSVRLTAQVSVYVAGMAKAGTSTKALAREMATVEAMAVAASGSLAELGATGKRAAAGLTATGTAAKKTGTDLDGTGAKARKTGKDLDQGTSSATRRKNLDTIATGAAGLGVALLAPAAAAIKLGTDFDHAMSAVKANVDDKSAPALARLRDAALEAGKTTQYSAIQAAEGEDELAKAGVGVTDIVNGGLKGALSLAAAGNLDVGSAAEIAATAMTQFGLSGRDIPHIADLLAAGADKAQGSVQDLGNGLKYVGPVAASMGVSLESTVGVLTEFANQGIIGEQAGTSLRGMLSSLTSPSVQARGEMQKLGLQLYDSNGKFIGMAGAADQLHDKLGSLTDAQRDTALGMIFGNEQVTAARVLMQGGAVAVNKYTKEVNDQGFAAKSAATKMDNLAGDLTKLKAALETTLIESSSGATKGLRDLTQGATAAVNVFASLPSGVQQAIVVIGGITGATLLAGAGLLKLKAMVGEAQEALTGMGSVGGKIASGLGAFAKYAPAVGGIAIAVVGLAAALNYLDEQAVKPVTHDVDKLAASLETFGRTGKMVGEANEVIGKNLQVLKDLKVQADQTVTSYNNFNQKVSESTPDSAIKAGKQYKENLTEINKALVNLVQGGHITEAVGAYNRLRKEWIAGGLSAKDFDKNMRGFTDAQKAAGDAAAGAGKGFGDAAQNARTLAGSMDAAVHSGQSLIDVWQQLNGATSSVDHAMLDANRSIAAVKSSIEQNGKAFTGNSTAALANVTAMEDASSAAAKAAQAKYEETGSVEQASAVYQRYKQQLINTLVQMGVDRKEAKALANTYFQMPKSVYTNVHNNAAATRSEVAALTRQLNALNGKRSVVYVDTVRRTYQLRTDHGGRELGEYADGGIVHAYAPGGFEDHVAQIAPAGAMRLWAEPETGGEAYIPLAPSKRARSMAIWEQTGRRLGVPVSNGAPTVINQSSGGPSASAIASALAQQLAPTLGAVAAAIAADKVTSLNLDRIQLGRAVESSQRFRGRAQ